jgi:arylsulfatase A-like enzyme
MFRRLRILLVLVPMAAAADSVLTGLALSRPPAPSILFVQSLGLWALLGLISLVPATLAALLRRSRDAAASAEDTWGEDALGLAGWLAFPVMAHASLDRYTSLGADGSGVLAPRPLLEVFVLAVCLWALARWGGPRLSRGRPRPLGPVLAAGALFVGALLPVGSELAPRPGGWGGAETGSSDRAAGDLQPNLLLLVWDTTRSANLGSYGYERETTPRLDEFARHSLVYEDARSVSCFTLTSHLSMLTGVYPSHHGASLGRMFYDAERTPPLTVALARAGYRTGGFVGTSVLRAETGMAYGFEVFDDRVDPEVCQTHAWALVHDVQSILAKLVPALNANGRPHLIQDFERPDEEVLAAALSWIERPDPRPWFCMVNLYDVHWPYLPGGEAARRFVRPYDGFVDGYVFRSDNYPERAEGVRTGERLDSEDNRHLEDLYDGEMWEMDREVGTFLDALDLSRSNTAVMVVSDHGEAFGEGGRYEHNDILEVQVRVPFILYLARDGAGLQPASGSRPGRVSGVDVAATLLGLAGLPVPEHMRGLDLIATPPTADRPLLVEDRDKLSRDAMHLAFYRGDWKLLQAGLGEEPRFELYHLGKDPQALTDVAADHPELLETLRGEMEALRAPWDPDRGGGVGVRDSSATGQRALRGLGYIGEE